MCLLVFPSLFYGFQVDSDKDDLHGYYSFRYSAEYAKEHHLPKDYMAKLDPRLAAIELVVMKDRHLSDKTVATLFSGRTFDSKQRELLDEGITTLELIYRSDYVEKKVFPVEYEPECYWILHILDAGALDYPEHGAISANRATSEEAAVIGLSRIKEQLDKQGRGDRYQALLDWKNKQIEEAFSHHIYLSMEGKKYDLPIVSYQRALRELKGVDEGLATIQVGPDKGCHLMKDNTAEKTLFLKNENGGFEQIKLPSL